MNDNILSIKHLYKSYNSLDGEIQAIEDLNFDVKKGEFLSIIGSSGCGKSTILNILTGLDKDYTGSYILDKDVVISYMLQEDALFPWLTVYENALIGLKIKKKCNSETKEYVNTLLKKYGLYEFKDAKISSLSGGMRQRVG